jgi:hypothetical protein
VHARTSMMLSRRWLAMSSSISCSVPTEPLRGRSASSMSLLLMATPAGTRWSLVPIVAAISSFLLLLLLLGLPLPLLMWLLLADEGRPAGMVPGVVAGWFERGACWACGRGELDLDVGRAMGFRHSLTSSSTERAHPCHAEPPRPPKRTDTTLKRRPTQ